MYHTPTPEHSAAIGIDPVVVTDSPSSLAASLVISIIRVDIKWRNRTPLHNRWNDSTALTAYRSIMRSNSISSISSVSSRAASAEPEETMQIFVKDLAGNSEYYTNDSICNLLTRSTSLHPQDSTIDLSRQPSITTCPSHRVIREGVQTCTRWQTPLILDRATIDLQHHRGKHRQPSCSAARWRTKEGPMYAQGLQRRSSAHRGRLWLLRRSLLWQASYARITQLSRPRRLQGAR